MTAPSEEPWTGPWADDARRLFQVFQHTVEQVADQLAEAADSDDQHPPECRYCPVCRGIGLLRQAGPDVLDQVSELAAGLAATLRATAPPSSPEPENDGPLDEPAAGPVDDRTSAPPRPPSTVRIDVTD